MARYPASMQFRTTFEQSGRVAGLAGDLNISEAEVTRRLITWALEQPGVAKRLRAEIHQEEERGEAAIRRRDREQGEPITQMYAEEEL